MQRIENLRSGDFKQIGIVAKYEVLKHLRRKRLYAVLVISALVAALQFTVPLAFNIAFPQEPKNWAYNFFSFINFLIIITGAFFAGDAIASEFEHKTGFIVFQNPVKRSSLVIGKFLAAFASALLALGFYYVLGACAMLWIYGSIPVETASSFAYAILYICSVLGFTFLFSSMLKGSMGATLLSFFTFFLIFSITSSVITLTGNEPWYIPTYASGIINNVFNPQQDTIIEMPRSSFRLYQFYPKLPISAIILATYFVATLASSVLITKRKEMV